MLRSFPIHGVLATQVPSSGPESLPPFATRNDPSHSRKDLSLIPEYPPRSFWFITFCIAIIYAAYTLFSKGCLS